MEHDLVVEGRTVLPEGDDIVQIGVTNGIIREIKKQGLKGSKIIRTGTGLVFPGFIDGHVHLREPGWEHKEDFATGTAAAVHGGVTTVVDMPNNPKPATTPAVLEEKRRLALSKGLIDVRFHGGVLSERIGDLKSIQQMVVGYKLYLARSTGGLTFPQSRVGAAMEAVATTGMPLSLHCEDQSVIDARETELAGERRPDIYCDLRPPEAEVSSVEAVVSALTGVRDARVNICHISVSRAVSLVGQARTDGLRIACEATLHHLFFSRNAMEVNRLLRTNPPLRSVADRAMLLEGLREGAVDFLVTDHAPHTIDEKTKDGSAGVPGLDDYGHVVSWLLKTQGFEPAIIARVSSANPAAFYGLGDRGEIAVGRRADLAIVDLGAPERASADKLRTKCGWTPYEGIEFPGRVRWTIRAGEVLLEG